VSGSGERSLRLRKTPHPLEACAVPDSIAVRGNEHVDEATIRGDAGLVAGANLNYRDIQRAIRNIFATGSVR
jgi:outer membrane protein assembly factor BamA